MNHLYLLKPLPLSFCVGVTLSTSGIEPSVGDGVVRGLVPLPLWLKPSPGGAVESESFGIWKSGSFSGVLVEAVVSCIIGAIVSSFVVVFITGSLVVGVTG